MEPHSTRDATKYVMQILDAKYKKLDLQSIVRDNCKHLSVDWQKQLLQLLKKYESLFDGTLGDWRTKPVSFQWREGVSPNHGQAFLVPKIDNDTIIKEYWRETHVVAVTFLSYGLYMYWARTQMCVLCVPCVACVAQNWWWTKGVVLVRRSHHCWWLELCTIATYIHLHPSNKVNGFWVTRYQEQSNELHECAYSM